MFLISSKKLKILKFQPFTFRSSPLDVFLGKCVLKIRSKFTGECPYQSVISIKLQTKFIEITFCHGCSPVNLLHIFRTLFPKTTSWGLLLNFWAVDFVNLKLPIFEAVPAALKFKKKLWELDLLKSYFVTNNSFISAIFGTLIPPGQRT